MVAIIPPKVFRSTNVILHFVFNLETDDEINHEPIALEIYYVFQYLIIRDETSVNHAAILKMDPRPAPGTVNTFIL